MLAPGHLLPLVHASGNTAAFDADGTLWADDIGEAFLRDLEAEGLVPAGTWRAYEVRLAADHVDAYGFAVTAMSGLPESLVAAKAEAFFPRHFEGRLFPAVRELVSALGGAGVRLAIVSASNRWLIEAAARILGVPHVAGVAVEVEGGRLTDRLIQPLPSGEGKVEWARRLLGDVPALAVGNGEIDLPLLRAARHRVVICPSSGPETVAAAEGRRQGWPVVELDHPCPDAPLP